MWVRGHAGINYNEKSGFIGEKSSEDKVQFAVQASARRAHEHLFGSNI